MKATAAIVVLWSGGGWELVVGRVKKWMLWFSRKARVRLYGMVGPFGNTSLKVTLRHVICEQSRL